MRFSPLADFLIQPLLTPVHRFLYLNIGFWILKIAIRPTWNNCYDITNYPARLHLSQMKRISGSHYFFHLSTNSTSQHLPVTALSLHVFKLLCSVLRRVNIGRIYSLIAWNLKFDWSIQITWKCKAAGKHKYLLVQGRWFIFIKQISKQPFAEVL